MTSSAAKAIKVSDPQFDWYEKVANRDTTYVRLIAASNGGRNNHLLACMLASWCVGDGVLPARFGLSKESFQKMLAHNFPGVSLGEDVPGHGDADYDRMPERDDLVKLLLDERAGLDENEQWLAEVIAAACMGMDHLWQDLGLWSRTELTEMLQYNFPTLAARNDRDMKWKKFLYKQLCEKQGIYVCRAPSCDVCSDYHVCFGPEE